MLLSELLCDTEYEMNGEDVEITSVAYDSRKVKEGTLFVAIKGYDTDGHKYIDSAIKNGAVAILAVECEDKPVTVVKVKDTRKALAKVSAAYFGYPASKLKIVGVTGTNGKTTTTYIIKQILELKGYKTGLIGTNQNMIGDEVLDTKRTTPESYELQELFKTMVEKGITHVIMEVSSHSLYLSRTYGIKFDVGVFTNLTQDHLDFHETMQNYMESKAILFKNSKIATANADDCYSEKIMKLSDCKFITYGVHADCDLKAENIKLSEIGVIFNLNYDGEDNRIRLAIPGMFSVYNALAAISACIALGIDMDTIIKGLVLSRSVKGRLEVVRISAPYTVIIDYAHTPDGMKNIINAVKSFAKGRIITLFGCGGDRDKSKRAIMGETAAKLSDFCVVTSDNPRSEEPSEIIKDIESGMTNFKDKYKIIEDRTKAIEYAMSIAYPDDIIILAGKGHETTQTFKDRTIDFDEREIVKKVYNKLIGSEA